MHRQFQLGLLLSALVLIPLTVYVWWWRERPTSDRRHRLEAVDRALAAGNLDQADEGLRRLLAEGPDDAQLQLRYAQVLRRQGRLDDASVALLRAMQLGLPEADGLREYALVEATDHFPLAEPALQRVLEERPTDREALQILAEGYARTQNWVAAEKAYTRWLEAEPDRVETYLGRAQVRQEAGQFAAATADLRQFIEAKPRHFLAHLLLANCLLADAHLNEAEAELRRCRELQPARPEPLVGLATCALERGGVGEAEGLVKEALELDPGYLPALQLQGDLAMRQHRYEQAVGIFERILRTQPNDRTILAKAAQALVQTGDAARAKQYEARIQQLEQAAKEGSIKGAAASRNSKR